MNEKPKSIDQLLNIKKGVTAVIGSGGKTSLIHALAKTLRGKVIVCTTTHIYPSTKIKTLISATAEDMMVALEKERVICVGEPCEDGKMMATSVPISQLEAIADYVLVEADGAKQKPIKAHADYEPKIPEVCSQTILVVGASGFNSVIQSAVHRPQTYTEITQTSLSDCVTSENLARLINYENLADQIYINQIEKEDQARFAERLAKRVCIPMIGGSLKKGNAFKL